VSDKVDKRFEADIWIDFLEKFRKFINIIKTLLNVDGQTECGQTS